MEDKNYYINEKIGDSGIANTRNPIYSTTEYDPFKISGRSINVGNIITPTSKYDETIGSLDPVIYGETTVGDLRARQQSGLARMGNALVNNIVIAGTTAISGTLGLVDGIFSALGEGNIQKIWDNDVNNWAVNVQERTREALPIYRGQEYENKSLVQKLGSGIFWADLVQNLGFAEGMLIPGIGMSKIVSSAPKLVRSLVPSLTASIGEASIEAINSKNDETSYKLRIANDEYNRKAKSVNSQFALGVLDSEYNNTLDSIEYDANTAGNFVFGSNVALLTLSNAIQFGNLFSRGFGTSKRLKGALKRTGDTYSTDNLGLALLSTGSEKILDATSEGIEEVAQGIISNTPSNFTDYNTFNSSMFNSEKRELVANLWQAMGESYSQALGDSETGVEFATGFIIGALGIPTIRRGKFPIGIENNIGVELYDKYKEVKKQQELADNINSRLQDNKKINSYYNGLVRHLAIQDRMNIALDADDMFDYKNAESAQFISDIMMFDDAGDIDHLKNIINNSIDTSDEGIDTIIEETSKDGKGPFMLNGNALSREDVRYILNEKIGVLNSKIDNYIKDKESLESTYPNMDNETLSNALFLKEQFRDHFSRYDDLLGKVHQDTNKLLSSLPQESSSERSKKIKKGEGIYITTPEGKRKLVRKSDIAYFDDNGIAVMKEEVPTSTEKLNVSKNALPLLLKDPSYIQYINTLLEKDSSLMTYDERQALQTNIQDLLKLETSLNTINKELKEILLDSTKSAKDFDKNKEDAVKADIAKKSKSLKERLTSARDLSEFREALNNEEDDAIKEETLKALGGEGNQLTKDYKEVNNYNKEVQKAINELDEPHAVKMDALKLFQEQFNNSNNLSEIANPNSIFIDDGDILYDDTLTDDENIKKFQEAQYALLKAMNKVNNDNKFKDRFSQSYRALKQKGNPVPNAPEKDTTGDSGTSTIPSVDTAVLPTTNEDVPVGDISSDQLEEDNKNLNDQVETQDDLDNKYKGRRPYYRPAIPELHIEASKEGDFRPFNKVVAEREKGVNVDSIYNYLKNSGAFTYVNEGNLKAGDELGFMIDPEFENKVASESWHTKPTIFIIDTRNGQIVGSLDESAYSVDRYEGLKGLQDKIRQEFSQVEDKTKRFIATPTTKVSQIMIGKIPYGKGEKSLSDIDNVSSEDSEPIFGIVRNGVLFTNGRLDHDEVITPGDMRQKEGRIYLLIHNAAGKHSPAAVRVKHFNRSEFNPEDVIVQNTPIFKRINNAINMLALSNTEEDIEDAIKELKKHLYIGRKKDRTSYIEWFTSDKGDGIRFTKIARNTSGERTGKEYEKVVYFTEKSDTSTSKSVEQLEKEITNILLDFNLPIQVNSGMLNTGEYNNILISSGVLTSNITDARVVSSWFTTDYFDEEGNLKKAINPTSALSKVKMKNSPVGGNEGVISGTPISMGGTVYYVDLSNNTVTDLKGNSRFLTDTDDLLSDLAWAQDNFGNATQSLLMIDNKVVTPSGRVLDRKTQKYLSNEEAQKIKDKIANREISTTNTNKVIAQIEENQRKVDKTRTDEDYYYILEEDGQYHEYERVHSRLGSNWVESKKQADALRDTKLKLVQLVDNITQYNNYLTNLSEHYGVDLSSFSGKTDAKSRDTIVAVIRDSMSNTNSQRALKAGTAVDSIVRSFFTSTDTPIKPDNMSEAAFTDLLTSLIEIKSNIEARGEKFLSNNIVLFQKYSDGTRVAGEVDILSVDTDGNFRIYDVKTRGYSFYVDKGLNLFDWTINGKKATKEEVQEYINKHFKKPFTLNSNMSDKDYYTLQLSAYKNLFESQYNAPITSLAILPFVLSYDKDTVTTVNKEKGIRITYNPAVNVPLVSSIKANPVTATNSTAPIFNSTNEILDPINDVLPEFILEDSKVGYFIRDGKLHKGFLSHVGQVNGIDVHMTKVPDITRGFGRSSEKAHAGINYYYAVFPNGNTISLVKDPRTMSEQKVKDTILGQLNGNPQRVSDMSNEKTLIFDPANDVPTKPTKLNTGAAESTASEREIFPHDDEFEDTLRAVDTERTIWNQEEELAWIKKVLPQLSDNDRIRVVKGLIRVASSGSYAWGQFNNGIITLSDIAAEGTAYHEAFHVVFSSLLNPIERVGILKEAEKKFGKKNAKDLEEDLAEEFREFVMQGGKDTRSLGTKILDFFKSLLAKVFNWKYFTPSAIYYYRAINNGYYADRPILSENSITTDSNNAKYRLLSTTELDNIIQEEYNAAKKIVQSLNNRRYLTKEDALRSFRDSGINPDLFYRITGSGANNAIGHKIQLLTNDMFNKYKEAILEENEFYLRQSIKDQEMKVNWDRLDPEIQMYLLNKGWTQEKFDSISQIERDYAIRCASI